MRAHEMASPHQKDHLALVLRPVRARCVKEPPIEQDAAVGRHQQRDGADGLACPALAALRGGARLVGAELVRAWTHPRGAQKLVSSLLEKNEKTKKNACNLPGITHVWPLPRSDKSLK